VRNAAPYTDIDQPVTIIAGESQILSFALIKSPAATPTPTTPAQPSPAPTVPAAPPRVDALPNTGALGDFSDDSGAMIGFAALLAGVILTSAIFIKRRIE